jgi:hypothetical protein
MINYLFIWLREILACRKYRQACEEYLRIDEQIRRLQRYQRQVLANQQAMAWREWQDIRSYSQDAREQVKGPSRPVKILSILTGARRSH